MAEKIVIAELEINTKALIENSAETLKMLNSLKEQQKQLQKETSNLTSATDEQAQQFVENASNIKTLTQSYNANLKVLSDTSQAIADQEAHTQLLNLALETEVTSIVEAREQNKLLTKIRNEVNVATEEGQNQLALLNNKINENNNFVKENGDAMLQQKMNIGNYSEGMKNALAQINPFNGGLTGFIERSKEAGGVGNLVKGSLSGMANGFMGVTKASLSFIATPIGAILAVLVLAFALVKNAMDKSEESTNKITKIFTIFSGITSKLLKFLEPLGVFLIDGIVKGFELAGKAADKALDIISGGLELLGFEGAAKNVKAFKNEMVGAVKDAAALADAEAKLATEQRKSQLIQLEYQKKAEKLRQIRDDESLSIKERIQANNDLGIVLKQQLKDELRIALTALEVANLRIKAEGKTKETLDAQAEALTTVADIQERITGQESEQLANLNSLRKEANDKEKERIDQMVQKRKEAQDKRIEQMNEELALYIAKNQSENKSVTDSLKYEQEVSKKRLEILKQEFDYGKISKQKYEEQKLLIAQENAQKQLDITLQNSKADLDYFIATNKSKIEDGKFLTESLLSEETKRLESIKLDKINLLEQEKKTNQEIIDLKIANNEALSIADKEYLTNKILLEDETQKQIDANRKTFETQKKAEQDEKLALEFQEKLIRLETENASEYELKLAQEQFQYENDLMILEQKKLAGQISEENYQTALDNIKNKHKQTTINIENEKQKAIVNGYATTFGQISQLLGEGSKVGQAFAIAQTTMSGYQAVMDAYATAQKSPITVLNPAYPFIQAGITGAFAVAQVAKVSGVKFEQGGLMEIGGKRHSQGGTKFVGEDGTTFEAEQGELIGVMNRNASRMFMEYNNKYRNGGLVQRNNVFATGGFVQRQNVLGKNVNAAIDYNLLADKMTNSISNLPNPIVDVKNIIHEQNSYVSVVTGANH